MAQNSMRKKSPSPGKGRARKAAPHKPSSKPVVRPTATLALPYAPEAFIESFYVNVLPADLAPFSVTERKRIAASIWHLAQTRKPGTPAVRLYNPSLNLDGWTVDHTVLEIVNDDMPFLVDSVTGALQRRGLTVHLAIHPVLQTRRDGKGGLIDVVMKDLNKLETGAGSPVPAGLAVPESMMHVEFDHCLDPAMLAEIEADIRAVLSDVRAAVEDWPKMRERLRETVDQSIAGREQTDAAENTEEVRTFLRWLDDNNFTLLGYRDIDLVQEGGKLVSIKVLPETGLGILRNADVRMFGGLRDLGARQSPNLQLYVRQHHLLVITKTNQYARVHRLVPMDAIFVRRFDTKGNIVGERLFVGLFTSQSYTQTPNEIPFLRRKIEHVLARAGFRPGSHDGKSLVHILNNYPHDELFQISEDDLYSNALGILQLQERARVALFLRRDPFGRFVTCLIYVPRDRYDSTLRHRFERYLEQVFDGHARDWTVRIDDSLLARAFVTIYLKPNAPVPARETVEAALREMCRSWPDRLRDFLVAEHGEAAALALLRRYGEAFPATYREAVEPIRAVRDIHHIERGKTASGDRLIVDLSPPDQAGFLHLKLFRADKPIALAEVLPLIENTGLKIEYMGGPYEVRPKDSERSIFIHEFVGGLARPSAAAFTHIKPAFEDAFVRIWSGEVESDAFNALTLIAGLTWREIALLRAFARYLRQLRIPYSHAMMADTFLHHAQAAQQILRLFFVRHHPDHEGNRAARAKVIEEAIGECLTKVEMLEEDRIIRRYLNLVQSSLRTNFFQRQADGAPKSYVAIKFDSHVLDFMPLPKPLYEIFIYSPRVEAVHLRGGKIARGGIRWSDRRDDFRNEILGLMKAQMVKNSVIVPVGSKGGFIVKRPPAEPDKLQAEGIACYRIMMCGLLDITDNRVGNKIVPPERVVRHDGDDPYLVVAADKGTAKFSDIANGIAQEFKFWLDDAFASGGSAGYDHKEMAITARGAWEAIKRHFRESGKDIQTTDFTCVGVGDMSGDVFGNGMLLSKHIRLLGAFDHRHIFCDPNPDAAASFTERQRLFDLPRSSWADYDKKKISKGGGVFARNEKTVKLTPEIRKAFGITVDSLTPAELIQAMLKAEAELLYFGGIGTYIKAGLETHDEIGDRATEALRVDACDLRAKVIGEGANLGVTQRGRIEYALKGGRINTDAIDNSAGVDTSDHEVNIKILLRKALDRGTLKADARNTLLRSMTDDVAQLVLRDNYMQTQALSIAEARAAELLPLHVRAMHRMEKSGLLNRTIEYLPSDSDIAERQRLNKGLTRPELSVLLAYAKIWLYQNLVEADQPDDEYYRRDVTGYFPEELQKRYAKEIGQHQLAHEIAATVVTNSIVNRAGAHFVFDMLERTGKDVSSVVRAYLVAREVFRLRDIWRGIEELDNHVAAKLQTSMHHIVLRVMNGAIHWFLSSLDMQGPLEPIMEAYGKSIAQLAAWLDKHAARINGVMKKSEHELLGQGVPAPLARSLARLPVLATALDLTQLVTKSRGDIGTVAEIYFALGQKLGFDWLSERAHALVAQTPWQREAVADVLGDLTNVQRRLTALVAGTGKSGKDRTPQEKFAAWLERNTERLESYNAMLTEWRGVGAVDISMLTLASRQLARIAEGH